MGLLKTIKVSKKDFEYAADKLDDREDQFYEITNDDNHQDDPEFYRTFGAAIGHIFYDEGPAITLRPDYDAKEDITILQHLRTYGYIEFDVGAITYKIQTCHFFG